MVETEPQELSPRQMQVLQMICRLHFMAGGTPTIRQLMQALNIGSTNGVVVTLEKIEAKGWIYKEGFHSSRSWKLAVDPPGWTSLPGGGICPDEDLPELVASLQAKLEAAHG